VIRAIGAKWPATPERLRADVDETEIIARAQRDRQEFAPLYERYLPIVYGYCRLRLNTVEAAEDATAVIFTKALAALPGYRPGAAGGFRAWLFTIAHHAVTDVYREQSRRPVSRFEAAADLVDRAPNPEEQAISTMDGIDLRRALTTLPDEQRRIVELRLAGLTDREIATALGRGHGAVRTSQMRAVRRLRAMLNPSHDIVGQRR
jgi:RNA polymerase sigma-70 factor (ECF subfamily)